MSVRLALCLGFEGVLRLNASLAFQIYRMEIKEDEERHFRVVFQLIHKSSLFKNTRVWFLN